MTLEIVNPESLGAPRGWSNGLVAPAGGRMLFVAGQVASDDTGEIVADDFVAQFTRSLENVLAVVRDAGGRPDHLARFTIYVTNVVLYRDRLKEIGVAYRELMGRHYPAMALLEVKGLMDPRARIEIEATAVLPEKP